MDWFFSGLLIAVSGATVIFTGYLVRRLFTIGLGPVDPGPVHPASAEAPHD